MYLKLEYSMVMCMISTLLYRELSTNKLIVCSFSELEKLDTVRIWIDACLAIELMLRST